MWSTLAGAAPGHVNFVLGANHPSSDLPQQQGPTEKRRSSRFPVLRSWDTVAERLGITDRGALSRSSNFLTGVASFVMPASYEPLGESVRLSAVQRRAIMRLTGQDSFELASARHVGESWYMDFTRNFDTSLGKNNYGLVFVESKTWLLRVRFFQEKSATRLVEGLEWLRAFVRRTTCRDLLEVHGDSDTSWTVPGRGRDLNSAVVDDYVNSAEPPISVFRCPPGTQSPNFVERGQKKLLMLCNLNLNYGRLSLKGWEDMLFEAEGQLDHHPVSLSRDSSLRFVSRHEAYFGRRPDASAWIARPGQSVYFMVPGRKMTSGRHMSETGIFVRPCTEFRGWVIRCLRTRKLVVSRNAHVVKDPNSRHALLALSDDLVGRHGSLDTSPDTPGLASATFSPLISLSRRLPHLLWTTCTSSSERLFTAAASAAAYRAAASTAF